ncbi:MAG: chorismate mutase, partial [Lachnospiraceae bacterium]|nr:chorismate mutase [Lachnospiraceae bacterium]
MDLLNLREQLDDIDARIVELYEKRMEICGQVAEYKIETGRKVFDRKREQEKLEKVKSLTHNDFNSHGVEELFEQIMSMSRKLQYRMLAGHGSQGRLPFIEVSELDTENARVVFQGAEGAYSQVAMMKYFGKN